jgi:peptidoglycan/LPS O-acetylase OafA/YrhL
MMKPNTGRVLSAAGAALLLVSLVLIWYHVDRPTGVQSWTGWRTFPRLRWLIAGAAVLTLASALARQVRWVVLARTVLGVIAGVLILRRIIDPPPLSSPMHAQPALYIGFVAAVAVALGGLVDTGRRVMEGGLNLGGPGLPELPPGPPSPHGAAVRVPNEAETRSR